MTTDHPFKIKWHKENKATRKCKNGTKMSKKRNPKGEVTLLSIFKEPQLSLCQNIRTLILIFHVGHYSHFLILSISILKLDVDADYRI